MQDFEYLTQLPGTAQERAWLRERLETLGVREGRILAASMMLHPAQEMTLTDVINRVQYPDEYKEYFPAENYEQLGAILLCRESNMPEDALPYINLHKAGLEYANQHPGVFVGNCYAAYTDFTVCLYNGTTLPEDSDWSVKVKTGCP